MRKGLMAALMLLPVLARRAEALFTVSRFSADRLAAQQALTQDQLLQFDTFGNVSLIHVTDIHAQLKPIYFREPSVNIGVGENKGEVPHVTGADFRRLYGIEDGSPSHQVIRFQMMPPSRAHSSSCEPTSTTPASIRPEAMVLATAVPHRAPIRLVEAARATA